MSLDLRADLSEHLAGDFAELDPDTDQPPVLDGIEQADRALRRLSSVHTEMRRVEVLAADEIARIERWKADRLAVLERQEAFWRESLEAWHRATFRRDGVQTVKLPCGTLKLTKARPRIDGTEPPEDAPASLVRETVKRAWDKATAAKATKPGPEPIDQTDDYWVHSAIDTTTGEVVPGLTHLVPKATHSWKVETEVVG